VAEIVRDMHERITIYAAPTERAEAEFVVHTIEQMIGGHSFFSIDSGRALDTTRRNFGFADFAMLYRTDAQSSALCEALERSGIPFARSVHEPLAMQPAIQTILAELEQGEERGARLESGEPPTPSLQCQLADAAARLLSKEVSLDPALIRAALAKLTALSDSCNDDRTRFIDALSLATDADFLDSRADRVSLLTLHAAKGLEFPVVFILGIEDGLLPLSWGDALDEAALAEERRLFYVGMTRAKDRLLLTRAQKRQWRGRVRPLPASPFLADIERELVKHQQSRPSRLPPPQSDQLGLF
jgi:DNA helicase-2/ATP-dependent DNA helicase PcrA